MLILVVLFCIMGVPGVIYLMPMVAEREKGWKCVINVLMYKDHNLKGTEGSGPNGATVGGGCYP